MASKKEIAELETKFWTAIRDRDPETATELMVDPCMLAGAQGAMPLSHKDYKAMAGDASWELHEFKMDKVEVQFPAEGVAVIGYIVTEDMTVEGKKLTMKAADTSTWIRRDSKWLCAAHTESILGDGFGRDKKPIEKIG